MKKSIPILQRVLVRKPVPIRTPDRPGRNQKCPCLSGLKYKKCCKTIPVLLDKLKLLLLEDEPVLTPSGEHDECKT